MLVLVGGAEGRVEKSCEEIGGMRNKKCSTNEVKRPDGGAEGDPRGQRKQEAVCCLADAKWRDTQKRRTREKRED